MRFESNVISYEYKTKESHLKHLEEYGLNKENKQDWLKKKKQKNY